MRTPKTEFKCSFQTCARATKCWILYAFAPLFHILWHQKTNEDTQSHSIEKPSAYLSFILCIVVVINTYEMLIFFFIWLKFYFFICLYATHHTTEQKHIIMCQFKSVWLRETNEND